ncbi:MAG: aminotransferase class III-fold pyridoxal phosphate-dependent enzyme [Propionibacteriaceae bacterium]|jgi:glutamate-1-semialdehyde 2,1-aminomutase|nr:aminotransferase class III-fold pyridoxal phosphate-dependent enzyme [Propionibacteriaceae bacterium]
MFTSTTDPTHTLDQALRDRARQVLPGGMYGHMAARFQAPQFPQFMDHAEGARIWDVDGNEYLDLMCSWGPILLGHHNPAVEAAVAEQNQRGDCMSGYSPRMVELAERFTDLVPHADWAMFAKNGTDVTTLLCTIARAHTGRDMIYVARGAYHGAAPWCTPHPAGVTAADRVNLGHFEYNDLDSVRDAIRGNESRVAAILVCPIRHDSHRAEETATPEFARGVRQLCDEIGAVLAIDEVRTGFRIDPHGAWEQYGVRPDLTAMSKAIANGYALAAVLGADFLKKAAGSIYTTGSFWFSANSMAASLATIEQVAQPSFIQNLNAAGARLAAGLTQQAAAQGFALDVSGPPALPMLTFANDPDRALGAAFATCAVRRGVFLHHTHNCFIGKAHTPQIIDQILQRTAVAFEDLAMSPQAEGWTPVATSQDADNAKTSKLG